MLRAALLLAWLASPWQVSAQQPAQRIATLAPFLTELVYAAGAGDKLVGVSAYSDFPSQAKLLPVIADAAGSNLEALLALRVDRVLAWKGGTPAQQVEMLRAARVDVVLFDGDRLEDIPRLLREIGALAGTGGEAERAARDFERELAALRSRYAGRTAIGAMFEIWHRPLMTVSGKHFMSDALATCGGSNVFAHESGITPEISPETVLKLDPEVIIGAGSAQGERAFRANWASFPALSAVRDGHLIYLDPDLIQRQTPRILQGIRSLCVALDTVRSSHAQSRPSTIPAR
jgi:iron complex transport system substrate-binding protein